MANYLFKILLTILFSALIAYFYYQNPAHIENFDGYIGYLISIIVFYGIYKFVKTSVNNKEVNFSLYGIFGYFLLNLLILCLFFFGINDFKTIDGKGTYDALTGVTLFFKIIIFSILPIVITFLNITFGRKILKILNLLKQEPEEGIYNFLFSIAFGFFSFISLITIIGLIGFYNITIIFFILLGFLILSLEEIVELWNKFIDYRISFENHDFKSPSLIKNFALKLLSTEFLFILATIILGVNLINIIRPMPIGWDDLGVYMNYPRQMAHSGSVDFLGGMYAWQIFTGIGFMIFEPVQAFFLNNIGGFLSFVVIILVISDLLKENSGKLKTILNIPLLLATIFISMPMVVFQQAKDMKLDEGLFFISVIVVYLIYKNFKKSDVKVNFFSNIFPSLRLKGRIKDGIIKNNIIDNNDFLSNKKINLKLLFIIGILTGFAFAIKFTSLLLISAIIGVLFYSELGFLGFLGYLGLFFAIFTKGHLWDYLNVIYPKNDIEFVDYFSLVSLVFGIIFIILGYVIHKNNIGKLFRNIFIFILGIIVSLLPWFAKNFTQLDLKTNKISVGALLNGKQKSFKADFLKIYSKEQLKDIERKKKELSAMNNSGTTTNEDMGRYLGYEKGINNYVKLPWNLTMQKNQGGEFTTLGWLFLALIPILFLFLEYRRKGLEYVNLIFIAGEILLFINLDSIINIDLRVYLTNFFSQIHFPFGYLILFGISIIPVLFLLFSLKNSRLNNLFKINLVFAFFYIFLFVISAYGIVWYGIVLYFNLLLMIGISLYKIGEYKKDDDEKIKDIKLFGCFVIFLIFVMYFFLSVFPHTFNNLKNAGQEHFKAGKLTSIEAVFAYHPEYKIMLSALNIDFKKATKANIKGVNLEDILYPPKNIANDSKIYRIGTFLKYFIAGNDHRLLEDSLLTRFDTYFYDKNSIDNTVERMKKIGLKYLLVDLNAATIDNDPRHDLTRRYEELLKTFTSTKLKLIETDSVCLKLALDEYSHSKKTKQDLEKYMIFAGVNYDSFLPGNKVIRRGKKLDLCRQTILNLIKNKKVDKNHYPYLLNLRRLDHGWKVLFEIK